MRSAMDYCSRDCTAPGEVSERLEAFSEAWKRSPSSSSFGSTSTGGGRRPGGGKEEAADKGAKSAGAEECQSGNTSARPSSTSSICDASGVTSCGAAAMAAATAAARSLSMEDDSADENAEDRATGAGSDRAAENSENGQPSGSGTPPRPASPAWSDPTPSAVDELEGGDMGVEMPLSVSVEHLLPTEASGEAGTTEDSTKTTTPRRISRPQLKIPGSLRSMMQKRRSASTHKNEEENNDAPNAVSSDPGPSSLQSTLSEELLRTAALNAKETEAGSESVPAKAKRMFKARSNRTKSKSPTTSNGDEQDFILVSGTGDKNNEAVGVNQNGSTAVPGAHDAPNTPQQSGARETQKIVGDHNGDRIPRKKERAVFMLHNADSPVVVARKTEHRTATAVTAATTTPFTRKKVPIQHARATPPPSSSSPLVGSPTRQPPYQLNVCSSMESNEESVRVTIASKSHAEVRRVETTAAGRRRDTMETEETDTALALEAKNKGWTVAPPAAAPRTPLPATAGGALIPTPSKEGLYRTIPIPDMRSTEKIWGKTRTDFAMVTTLPVHIEHASPSSSSSVHASSSFPLRSSSSTTTASTARTAPTPNNPRSIRNTNSQEEVPSTSWTPISGSQFQVRRGPKYAKHKRKSPSLHSLYETVCIRAFRSDSRTMDGIANVMPLPLKEAFGNDVVDTSNVEGKLGPVGVPSSSSLSSGDGGEMGANSKDCDGVGMVPTIPDEYVPDMLIIHFQLPYENPNMFKQKDDGRGGEVVYYLRPSQRFVEEMNGVRPMTPATQLFARWCRTCETDSVMRQRFKCMAIVRDLEKHNLSWIKPYNGKPVLITESGRAKRGVRDGIRYLEMMANVHRWNFVAKKAFVSLIPRFKEMRMEVGFTIEAMSDDEMPECMLGSACVNCIDESTFATISSDVQKPLNQSWITPAAPRALPAPSRMGSSRKLRGSRGS